MKWIRERELDILCIQEHIAGSTKVKEWQRIAHVNGYCIRTGTKGDTSTRGGAAILARRDTFGLTDKDSGRHRDLEGGFAKLTCRWQDQTIDFLSLHVPSHEGDRKLYLTRLKRSGAIVARSIQLCWGFLTAWKTHYWTLNIQREIQIALNTRTSNTQGYSCIYIYR